MMLIRTFIAPSAIQGIGVFAQDFVSEGTVIWGLHEKLDVQISASEILALPPHMQEFVRIYSYPHLEMEGYVVVDADNGRFMNHSDSPNTNFRDFRRGLALRDIRPGEELTCDYRELFPAFEGFGPAEHAPADAIAVPMDVALAAAAPEARAARTVRRSRAQ